MNAFEYFKSKEDFELATPLTSLLFQLKEHITYLPKRISVAAILVSNVSEDIYKSKECALIIIKCISCMLSDLIQIQFDDYRNFHSFVSGNIKYSPLTNKRPIIVNK